MTWPTEEMGALAKLCGVPEEADLVHLRLPGGDTVYVLIGPPDSAQGSITTYDDFANGRAPYAHLLPSGRVMRYGSLIATADQIEWLAA